MLGRWLTETETFTRHNFTDHYEIKKKKRKTHEKMSAYMRLVCLEMGLEAYVLAEYRESLAKSQYIRLAA
jgi:hypothetical protein